MTNSPNPNEEFQSPVQSPPVVLYACIHNSGRSVAAKVLSEFYANGKATFRSAGSEPKESINPNVAAVLASRGLSTSQERPTQLTRGGVEEADVVVTMGCGETCPIFPGKRYLDWEIDDPADSDLRTVERIIEQIDIKVRHLLVELGVPID